MSFQLWRILLSNQKKVEESSGDKENSDGEEDPFTMVIKRILTHNEDEEKIQRPQIQLSWILL